MPVAALHSATDLRLEGVAGRVAVVTGSSSGIGRRVAETLAGLGAHVAGIDVRDDDTPATELSRIADVAEPTEVEAAFAAVESALGPATILVTAAGIFQPCLVADLDRSTWARTLDVNLTGTFLCAQRAIAGMRPAGGGRIVTVASAAGLDGGDTACAHYAASKGGVIALAKALARETAGDGITVNVVAPRNVRTPMIVGMEPELEAAAPVGRLGTTDDVAALVAFLCSDHASYVTGEVVGLTGGS
jgi:NAD(P)-dependent dehydrogenase (short-subunit alcohol dehydrogenase family)